MNIRKIDYEIPYMEIIHLNMENKICQNSAYDLDSFPGSNDATIDNHGGGYNYEGNDWE